MSAGDELLRQCAGKLPRFGGLLFEHVNWHSISGCLVVLGGLLWAATWRGLPETLHDAATPAFNARNLLRGYAGLCATSVLCAWCSPAACPSRHVPLRSVGAGVPGRHLQLGATQFFWFFMLTISGIMGGARLSGRLAARSSRGPGPERLSDHAVTSLVNGR